MARKRAAPLVIVSVPIGLFVSCGYRERIKQPTDLGANFYATPIPSLAAAGGRRVQDLRWPEGATLVSVRRGNRVVIPHGSTVLVDGDTITSFGSSESRIELAHTLEPLPPDPSES